jgi:hypothetical protein
LVCSSAIVHHTVLRCGSSPYPALFGVTSSPGHPSLRRTHCWCCDAESGIRLCRACRVSLRGACSPCACAPSVLPYIGGSTDDCARPGSRIQYALSRRRRGAAVLYGRGAPARYEAVAPALARGDQPTCRCCRLVCVRHAAGGQCRLGRAAAHCSPARYRRCVGTSVPSLGVRVTACVRVDSSHVRARASVAATQ